MGFLDCTNGLASFYAIGDEDIETLCPDLLLLQSEQVNAMDMGEEDWAKEDASDEMTAHVVKQGSGAAEGMVKQRDVEEALD